MQTFTLFFLIALLISTLTQYWLAARHISHVRAHRDQVPERFSSQISLADHQKAADYTCAKTRMEYLSIAVNVLLLLLLTLGGGLNMLHEFLATLFDDPLIHGMLLIISVFLIMTATEIPLSYYRTFVDRRTIWFQ